MKCALCGFNYSINEGATACRGCPLGKSCHMARCPNCGYETPVDPAEIKMFKDWRKRVQWNLMKRLKRS